MINIIIIFRIYASLDIINVISISLEKQFNIVYFLVIEIIKLFIIIIDILFPVINPSLSFSINFLALFISPNPSIYSPVNATPRFLKGIVLSSEARMSILFWEKNQY